MLNYFFMIIDSLENKKLIADNFIKIAGFEGWNDKALLLACEQVFSENYSNNNLPPIDQNFVGLIFENGVFSVIEFITLQRCAELKQSVDNNSDFANLRMNQKVAFLVYHLLKKDEEHKISLRRLNNFYLGIDNFNNDLKSLALLNYIKQGFKPLNQALQQLYIVADCIWNLCGDNSTDYNFYTKRLILAKILARSYIYFTKDSSPNSELTKDFIDKQIANIVKFSRFKKSSIEKL